MIVVVVANYDDNGDNKGDTHVVVASIGVLIYYFSFDFTIKNPMTESRNTMDGSKDGAFVLF